MAIRLRPDARRLRLAAAKLAYSGPSGWWLLLQAEASILAAAAMVRSRPRGQLIRSLEERYSKADSAPADFRAADEVAAAIHRAARFGPGRHLCLVRSIALHRLLERRGIRGSRVNVGVRMSATTFAAHAWVELNGRVIGDDPAYVGGFSRITGDADALQLLSVRGSAGR